MFFRIYSFFVCELIGCYDIGQAQRRADTGTDPYIPEVLIRCCDAGRYRHDAECPRFQDVPQHLVERGGQLVPARMNFRLVCCDKFVDLANTEHSEDCPMLEKNRPVAVDSDED